MIQSNIIFSSMPRYPKSSLPFTFSNQSFLCTPHLPHSCYISSPPHLPWFHHTNIFGKAYKLRSSSLCNPHHFPPFLPS
jgi:hypothetical protein